MVTLGELVALGDLVRLLDTAPPSLPALDLAREAMSEAGPPAAAEPSEADEPVAAAMAAAAAATACLSGCIVMSVSGAVLASTTRWSSNRTRM